MHRTGPLGLLSGYLILIATGIFVLIPIWFLLVLALDPKLASGIPSEFQAVPHDPTLDTFAAVLESPVRNLTFWGLLRNSFIVSGMAAGIALVFGTSMAYAFARMRFPGSRVGPFGLLVGAFLPPIALAVPLFVLLGTLENVLPAAREFGVRGSLLGLGIVYAAFSLPFCLWLMRAAFRAVPEELEEAAFAEGATRFRTFRQIDLPLAAPSILVAALLAFLLAYSEFAIGWLFVEKGDNVTLAMALAGQEAGFYGGQWGRTAALALLAALPVVLVFLVLQRFLLRASLTTATD
jgi:ABC-type glycerol-3-phosphate transport system permease component